MQRHRRDIPRNVLRGLAYALASFLLGAGCTDDFSRFRFSTGQQRSQPVAGAGSEQNMSTSTQSAKLRPQGLPSDAGSAEEGAMPGAPASENTTNSDGSNAGEKQADESDSDAGASAAGQTIPEHFRTSSSQDIARVGRFLHAPASCPGDFLNDIATNGQRSSEPFLIVTQVCRGAHVT